MFAGTHSLINASVPYGIEELKENPQSVSHDADRRECSKRVAEEEKIQSRLMVMFAV